MVLPVAGVSRATWAKQYFLPSVTSRKRTRQGRRLSCLFFPHAGPDCSAPQALLVLNCRSWSVKWKTQAYNPPQRNWGAWLPQIDTWCWAGASPQLSFLAVPERFDGSPCRERARFARGAGCGSGSTTQHCSLSGVLLASADLRSRRVDFLSCFQQSSLFRMRVFQGGCQSCTAPLVMVNPCTGKLHNGNCEENAK